MEFFLRFMVIQLLVVNLIGLAMFDFSSEPGQESLLANFYHMLYPPGTDPDSGIGKMLMTLADGKAQVAMQSTILNRDFYAGFCLLYMPFAMLMGLEPGKSPLPDRLAHRRLGDGFVFDRFDLPVQEQGGVCFWRYHRRLLPLAVAQSGRVYARAAQASDRMGSRHVDGVGGQWRGCSIRRSALSLSPSACRLSRAASSGKGRGGSSRCFPSSAAAPARSGSIFPLTRSSDYFNYEISNVTLSSHNYFMDLLCETGLAGFISFCGLFSDSCGSAGWRRSSRARIPGCAWCFWRVLAGLMGMFGSVLSSPQRAMGNRRQLAVGSAGLYIGRPCG